MIRPQRSPEISLPLPYFLASAVALVAVAAAVPFLAPDLVAGSDDPRVFALTHLAVLGWVTMTVMGALYQLFPVALGAQIHSLRMGRVNFCVYTVGVAGFVPSLYLSWNPGVSIFGSLAALGILNFALGLFLSYRRVHNWHPMAFYLLTSTCWFLVTIGFGVTWALDWYFNWFNITPNLLAAHVHAGLVGWLGCTLLGVSYKLMELFALSHRKRWRTAYANLVLWNGGLLGLVIALLLVPGSAFIVLFAAVIGASALVFVADLGVMFGRRRRRPLTLEHLYVGVSCLSLLLAAGMGLALAAGHPLTRDWIVAYGYVAIVGCFGFAIIGKYYKIIPFLVWLHRYSRTAGSAPTPLLRDLMNGQLGACGFALLFIGYAGVLGGLLTSTQALVETGGGLYFVGALSVAGQIGWLFWPGRQVRRPEPGSVRGPALPD